MNLIDSSIKMSKEQKKLFLEAYYVLKRLLDDHKKLNLEKK